MEMKNYRKYSRFELAKALDTNQFDDIEGDVLSHALVLLNHWGIYDYYAELGVRPVAESKFWLLYDMDEMLDITQDDYLWDHMEEADAIPHDNCNDTYEKLMENYLNDEFVIK